MIHLPTTTKLKIARILLLIVTLGRRLTGHRGQIVTCRRGGIRWRLDLDEGIELAIYLFSSFERSTARQIRKFLQPGMVVLDIGANIGAHALPMAKWVGPQGKVYAIEPTQNAYRKLNENLALNPALKVTLIPLRVALVEAGGAGPAALYSSWKLRGAGPRHPYHGGTQASTEGAEFLTLDLLVERLGIKRLDFIKLDVDGFECKILRGAPATLRKFRPAIILELCPYVQSENGDALDELLRLLKAAGYQLYTENRSALLPTDSAALARLIPEHGSINAFAQP